MTEKHRLSESAPPSAAAWCRHGLSAGAVLGLVLGAENQLMLRLDSSPALDGSAPATALQSVAAVGFTAAATALGMSLVSVATLPLLRRPVGRVLSVAAHATTMGWITLVYLVSVLLRTLSGSYLTVGAIEFGLNGNSHLYEAALAGFRLESILLVTMVSAAVIAAARFAARNLNSAPAARSSARTSALGVPVALAGAGLLPVTAVNGLSAASPELALLASALPASTSGDEAEHSASPVTTSVPEGPPLGDGDKWLAAANARKGVRPNVLLTTLESIALGHLGMSGYSRNITPNLDRLARRSARFRRAWTTATHSNYAQMAILSSLFPRRGPGLDVYKHIDYPRFLFHDLFHALSYPTATISSQDESWQGMLRFETTKTPVYRWHAPSFQGPHLDIGSELAVPDNVTIDQATRWMDSREGPWALYVNLQSTHFPYRIPPGEPTPFSPTEPTPGSFNYLRYPESDREVAVNRYDNALAFVDRQIGRLAKHLEDSGQLDDTIWIITADHGEMFFEHGMVTHGKTLFDAEARVPILVHWPARLKSMDVDTPVSNLDVMPTFADLVDLPPHPSFQGRSLLSASGADDDARAIFMNIQGLRTSEAVVCWPYKLIVEHTGGRVRLFDLEQDPAELEDLASKNVRVAEALRQTLRSQIRAQVEYHGKDNSLRSSRYAPRLTRCPALDNRRRTADSDSDSVARSTRRARPEATAGTLPPRPPRAVVTPVVKSPGG